MLSTSETTAVYRESAYPQSLSAPELFRACAGGDPLALEEFVRRYDPSIRLAVLRAARRHRCQDSMDDLAQHAYSRFFERPEAIFRSFEMRTPDADKAYVRVVATRAAIDWCRLRNRDRVFTWGNPGAELPEIAVQGDEALARIELEQVERFLLEALPRKEAARDVKILRLFCLHEFTAVQIAALASIGLTAKGVEAVIHRCRRLLAGHFRLEPREKSPNSKRIFATEAL